MSSNRILLVNPFHEFRTITKGRRIHALRLSAPIRGAGRANFELRGSSVAVALSFLRKLRHRSRIELAEIPPGIRYQFQLAGIVLPEGRLPKPVPLRLSKEKLLAPRRDLIRVPTFREIGTLREGLGRDGYALLPGFMPSGLARALESYYLGRIREGFAVAGDLRVRDRDVESNEAFALYFLRRYRSFVSALARKPLFCSNALASTYRNGAHLPWHRDSLRSELTLSIQLSPGLGPGNSWPLLVERPRRSERPAILRLSSPGDAIVFMGHRSRHSRPELRSKRPHTQLLLHYRSRVGP